MKIAIVVERFEPRRGGLERYSFDLAEWLAGAGHDVHVLSFALGPEAERLAVTRHRMEPEPTRWKQAETVERHLKDVEADSVHDLGVGWSFDVLQSHFGSRIVSRRADLASAVGLQRLKLKISPSKRRRYREMRAVEDRQYASPRGVIVAVSNMVRRHLEELHGVEPERIRVIHNCADVRRFSPDHRLAYRASTREQLGLKDEVLFLLSGHNFRLKGVRTAVEAAGLLASKGCRFRLAVLGDGAPGPYRRLASACGAGRHVTFCGFVEDPVAYYAAADAYVLPTFLDTCSLTVAEALASGLPAITTRWNGGSEIITPGQEGFILDDPRDAKGLAGFMERLLDESLRRRMGESARALAQRYSSEQNFRQIEALHLAAVAARGSD
jgi:UDP-glucose:(heptosyl)LPS alpha-1,3-glucosyltransferase